MNATTPFPDPSPADNEGANPDYTPPGQAIGSQAPFKLERWDEITFDLNEEFVIDGVIPKRGVGVVYGESQSLKSFVMMHTGLCVARGDDWAKRKTEKASVIYLAAEGAEGLRKRKAGYLKAGRAPPKDVDFALISAAPNLGVAKGDYNRLVATIFAAGIKPGLIIIDTVAKVIGGADENGAGMAQFILNAEALARHFGCFVLAVHHPGWERGKARTRGWSGLPAALDALILCERKEGEFRATLTVQKLKDEPSGLRFEAQMMRISLGSRKTGREVSTLVVDAITEIVAQAKPNVPPPLAAIPASRKQFMATVSEALSEHGRNISPSNGVSVRAVAERHITEIHFERGARDKKPNEDPRKLRDRLRKRLDRSVEGALADGSLLAYDLDERFFGRP
jgi:AAA domain